MKLNKKLVFILILIVIFIIYVVNVVYRYNILKQVRDSVFKFENCNNYMILENSGNKIYYKDGKTKSENILIHNTDYTWSNGEYFYCIREKSKKAFKRLAYDSNEFQKLSFKNIGIDSYSNIDILKMALDPFSIKISENKFVSNDKKVSNGIIILRINNEKIIYFDSNTKLPILYKEADYYNFYPDKIVMNVVKNEDVELNLDEYKIIDIFQDNQSDMLVNEIFDEDY